MDGMFLTRSYSDSSVGKLTSGKGSIKDCPVPAPLLLAEFQQHAQLYKEIPTLLVSTSDRILDTLKRAFNKVYESGERPDRIWIVFIWIPPNRIQTVNVHSAQKLAERCRHPEPQKFAHEYVFEWAIPEEFVVHTVSVDTLLLRGLDLHDYRCIEEDPDSEIWSRSSEGKLPPISLLRKVMAEDYIRDVRNGWDIGIALGCFARRFGARAPVDWIAHQLYADLVRAPWVDSDGDVHSGSVSYADGTTESLDPEVLPQLSDGIHTALIEWWLLDADFVMNVNAHNEWCDLQRDLMDDRWIDFYQDWHVRGNGGPGYMSAKDRLKHLEDRVHADIEKAALEIGL